MSAKAAAINSHRIGLLVDRLSFFFRSGIRSDTANNAYLFKTVLVLSNGIDYAVTHNDVPSKVHDLPSVIKQVYQYKTDTALESAIMLLMISVKNACTNGWFQDSDANELLTMANEISRSFCGATITAVEPSNALQIISKIISRFYPRMKMGQIIVSFEAKPGYQVLPCDFFIQKSMPVPTARERIWLFVVQTDNMETSSCIITPPEVNFLLNGRGVERRNNVSMDGGPQFPTDVSAVLKYGTNLIQVIGKFNGNYVIVITYASVVSSSSSKPLQDYVQPAAAELVSDAEIIEGPSRITLNCPISYKRINTPVKGHLCRHHQCFDFNNFLKINSRKPSWRCPHCNQSVCFTDLRIDQNMVKILKEVGDNVADVLISEDGSWKVVDEHDGITNQLQNGSQNVLANVIDLTMEGTDDGDVAISSTGAEASLGLTNQRCINYTSCETEDRKPFEDIQLSSAAENHSAAAAFNSASDIVQEPASLVWQNIWSRISLAASTMNGSVSHSAAAAAAARVNAPAGISESPLDALLEPVLTDAVSPALNREPVDGHGGTQLTTAFQNVPQLRQFVASENFRLQQSRFENSILSNEILRQSIPRQVTRTPIAVQALPAQTQVPHTHHQRTRPNVMPSTGISNGRYSVASQIPHYMTATSDGFSMASSEVERQQLSRSQITPLSASEFCSSSSQLHTMPQLLSPQTSDLQYAQNQLLQQGISIPATRQVRMRMSSDQHRANAQRASSGLLPIDHQNPCHQHPPNLGMSQATTRPDRVIDLAAGSSSSNQHTQPMVPRLSSSQIVTPLGVAPRLQASGATPSFATNASDLRQSLGDQRWHPVREGLTEFPSEENWRRSIGRMRGSLTGQSYSAALSQLMVQPTVPAQARPPVTSPQAQVNAHGQTKGQGM
ncbi:hypothetical protein AAC387_Pa01g2550 [Persea americana]|eukprot:TRINITY_DN4779_c0_g1_i2.p1 TRINITY_DN4779_c0_g1~~TRINITY_DN4779_c0_g1_i2.p1  ORF type:complete len:899 (-),score=156.84 TRINITY_DN4779_c0_g1_i2:316-3012(-)